MPIGSKGKFLLTTAVLILILVGFAPAKSRSNAEAETTLEATSASQAILWHADIEPPKQVVETTTTVSPTTTSTVPPTTTTQAPRPEPPPTTQAPQPAANVSGGSRWDRLAVCESGSDPPNWSINTGNGYYGGLQFAASTWTNYGGGMYASRADLASRDQQIAIAEKVLAEQGWAAWPACSSKLGYR